MRNLLLSTILTGTFSQSAAAFEMPQDDAAAQFVASNVVATFYHELGHALIDVLQLPVLGREEDAADSLASLLTHQIWDEEAATQITYDSALAYTYYIAESDAEGWELPFADVHSLDQQRYFNLICQFYGANPEVRQDVADELELPPERAELCEDEFALIEASWGAMLNDLTPSDTSMGLRLVGVSEPLEPIAALLAEEIATLNATYGLPREITVTVEDCGEANAFYYVGEYKIVMCNEYAVELLKLYAASQ